MGGRRCGRPVAPFLVLAVLAACPLAARPQAVQSIAGLQAAGAQVASTAVPPALPSPPATQQLTSPSPPPPEPVVRPLSLPAAPAPAPAFIPVATPAPAPAPTATPSENPDAAALKLLSQGSRNVRQLESERGLRGWVEGNDPCEGWTGVTCNEAQRVIRLELGGWNLETRLPPELSSLTELEVMNLTGNNLLGGLPSNWGSDSVFTNLTILDLSYNPSLSGALPPNWGTQGAFARLESLSLAATGISGQLPLAWGGNLSLPNLTTLDLSSNLLDGTLPAGWGTEGAFARLQSLTLLNNSLTGPLPAQWGGERGGAVFPALGSLDLSNNSLTGFLPSGWGLGFKSLTTLSIGNNSIGGQLPPAWAQSARWETLTRLDLHQNSLSGSVSEAWGNWSTPRQPSLVLLPGNLFCGKLSGTLLGRVIAANDSEVPEDGFGPCTAAPAPSPAAQPSATPVPVPAPLTAAMPAPAPEFTPAPAPAQVSGPTPEPAAETGAEAQIEPALAPTPVPAPDQVGVPSEAPVPAPVPSISQLSVPVPAVDAGAESSVPVPAPQPVVSLTPILLTPAPGPSPMDAEVPVVGPSGEAPVIEVEPPAMAPQSEEVPAPAPAAQALATPEGPIAGAPVIEVPVPVASPTEASAPSPAPEGQEVAQILARYNLTGSSLASNNETVQMMVLAAMRQTLSGSRASGVELQSLTPVTTAGRRLLLDPQDMQAIFLINSTSGEAPSLVRELNSSATTGRFGQELGLAGLPSVQPSLEEARITNPIISNPLAPAAAPPATPPIVVNPTPAASGGSSLSGGAIGGIIAGVAIAAAVTAAVALFCVRRRRRQAAAVDTEKGGAASVSSAGPAKFGSSGWLRLWTRRGIRAPQTSSSDIPDSDGKVADSVDSRAARLALKNRRPPQPDSPSEHARMAPMPRVAPGELEAKPFEGGTAGPLTTADSFEAEERHNIRTIVIESPLTSRGSPPHRRDDLDGLSSGGAAAREDRVGVAGRDTSPQGTETPPSERMHSEASPPSDHTAMMSSEIVADPDYAPPSEALSGFTSNSSSEGKAKVPVASSSSGVRTAAEVMQRIDEKREASARDLVGPSRQRSSRDARDAQGSTSLVAKQSRSVTLLRALERELRTAQHAPPSSYSRRHTAGEAQIRPGAADEKREASSSGVDDGAGQRPHSESMRKSLEVLEALERRPSGARGGTDAAKLRAEVEQILGQGGYLRHAGDTRAPPPSYHRRVAEEAAAARTASGRLASAPLSRPGSGALGSRQGSGALTSRQSSGALTGRPSGGLDQMRAGSTRKPGIARDRLARSGSGSGNRAPEAGLRSTDSRRPNSGLVRAPSGDRAPRQAPASADALAEDRQLRRQQSSQRETLLRDLERQLGLEAPAPQPREARPDAGRQRRDQRSDQRREIAQRARRLLEEMGSVDSSEAPGRQPTRSGSRRPKPREDAAGGQAGRVPNTRPL